MNVALGAFILTLLFLPAVSYRLAINRQDNLRELLSTFSITDSVWVFSVIPIIIHIILISLLLLSTHVIKFDLILNIFYSNKDFKISDKPFTQDVLQFLIYCFCAIVIGYALGLFSNFLETRNKLFSRVLGLGNDWYEVFEGNILNPSATKNDDTIDLVYVNVLSNTKETTILYSGILINYYYKPKSTELDYLVLQSATRRDLRKEYISNAEGNSAEKQNYYSQFTGDVIRIPGAYFIIPVKEILNVNVSYLNIISMAELPEVS